MLDLALALVERSFRNKNTGGEEQDTAVEVAQEETVLVELAVRAVQVEEAVVDISTFLIKGILQITAG